MGALLDSSVLVACERRGMNAQEALADIARRLAGEEVALSALSVLELAHGAVRADSPQRKAVRLQFLRELVHAVPVHPVTTAVAFRAGQIDGQATAQGTRIPLSDLLIGTTALELGYGVATTNIRHFQMVPGLTIFSF